MKVICEGIDLAFAANIVSRAINNKSINPTLECIRITAKDNQVELVATDLEIFIKQSIKADVKIEGDLIIPGKIFTEYLRKVNSGSILLSLDSNKLHIKHSDSECDFACLNVNEFPQIAKVEDSKKINILEKDLKEIISKTTASALTDDSRPILKGVYLVAEQNVLTAVALDGYRLAKVQVNATTDSNIKVIVPVRTLEEIKKLLDGEDKNILIEVTSTYIKIQINGTLMISKLITGEYINYSQIIPTTFTTKITVNKEMLEKALERASLLARIDNNNLVKFYIKDGSLLIKSNNEYGNIEEKVVIELVGPDVESAFNVKYFADALKNISEEYVTINFNSSVSPCVIKPIEHENYLFLILPVRII